jgi:hypothetical protein
VVQSSAPEDVVALGHVYAVPCAPLLGEADADAGAEACGDALAVTRGVDDVPPLHPATSARKKSAVESEATKRCMGTVLSSKSVWLLWTADFEAARSRRLGRDHFDSVFVEERHARAAAFFDLAA